MTSLPHNRTNTACSTPSLKTFPMTASPLQPHRSVPGRAMAVLAILLIAGCASVPGAAPGQAVTLAVGSRIAIGGTGVRYLGIANDSRCPAGVQCIRAGDADVLFDVSTAGGGTTRVVLNTERRTSAEVGNRTLELLDLAPGAAPPATIRVVPSPEAQPPE